MIQIANAAPRPWWGQRAGIPTLHTYFGPGGNMLDERVCNERDEGYWYLLDISDVAHYLRKGADQRIESDQPNALMLVNTFLSTYTASKPPPPMIITDLEIGYVPRNVVEQLRRLRMESFAAITEGPQLKHAAFALRVSPTGAMQLTVGQENYFFRSAFSYPDIKGIRFHRFGTAQSAEKRTWRPSVEQHDRHSIVIRAESSQYRVKRTITLKEDAIQVCDTLTNITDQPIGVAITNQIGLPDVPVPGTYRLAGVDRDTQIGGAAANPTLFIPQQTGSVGIVVEDNVYRLQLELVREANRFDFRTTHFGLDAGKQYTLRWTIYPATTTDYFDFINRVRRAWNVNYTIEGPFVFDRNVVHGRRAKIYVFGPWLDYQHDGTQTRQRYRQRVAPLLAALRKSQPNAVLMPRVETNLFTLLKTNIPGGDILPGSDRKTGRYGFVLNKQQSAVLEKALGPWTDSVLRLEDGRIIVDTYYPGSVHNKQQLFNLLVYVRENNYRYRLFLEQIDFLMDQIGFDGIYIDQFSLSGSFSRKDRYTYDQWDGHTVDLDDKGRIARRRTDCNLVGAAARARILKYILDKGGKVVINGHSTVCETRALPVYRFQEMDNDGVNPLLFLHDKPPIFYWQARGHLNSPIILGLRPVRYGAAGKQHWAEIITKGIITALRNGVLYYYYTSTIPSRGAGAGGYGPLNHMYPFTPIELHAGWLIGKERIITCVSRTFAWPYPDKPICVRFDLHGLEKPNAFQVRHHGNGWQVIVKLDDWNEIAVLEHAVPSRVH